MKYLILIGDGMGDYPITELNGKTPLEVAATPMIDSLCVRGELFFTKTVPDGFPPGSDVANMSLMGYDPARYYTGRAPLEAAAMGVTLAEDETAFRCNLVTLDFSGPEQATMIDFAAGHISNEESHQIIADLQATCGSDIFHFYPGVSYRHLLVVKGSLPACVTVPPHDHTGKDVTTYWQRYRDARQWRELMEKVGTILADHPVNQKRRELGKKPATMIWPWGEGKAPSVPTLAERFGITGSMISAVDLLKGLGVVGGLHIHHIPGATGYIDTNYAGKAAAAIASLATEDFVFVHLEGPDEAGHQGLLQDKLQAITDFDQRIVRPIIEYLRTSGVEFRAVITMDHFTPLAVQTHTCDAVPTLLYDSREVQKGCGLPFSEKSCQIVDPQMKLGLQDGYTLIERLLEIRG